MGYARCWTMSGPWQHPNGVWYLRRELPRDLWDARQKLADLGVTIGGKEVRRSLRTRDRKAAVVRYLEVATELEARWAIWRTALETGPMALSERNIAALAGERTKRFFEAHADNPSQAVGVSPRPAPNLSPEVVAGVKKLSVEDQQRLR